MSSSVNAALFRRSISCTYTWLQCDESGPPCRACAALDIPCTFERPSRRRGPPNRHAEAIKKRRFEDYAGDSPHLSAVGTSTPSSPTHAAQALASLSSYNSGQPLSAESICPTETLDLLIDDFFTYIHPLCPFPHEPSFREAWKRREDLSNKPFLALLSSMLAALVSSFPRKPRLHLKIQRKDSVFPSHMSLVNKCQQICAAARGNGYLERDDLNVYDAATSYFLALAGVYTFRWRQGRLYFGECMTILKTLGLHKTKEPSYHQLGNLPAAFGSHSTNHDGSRDPVDNITQEMGRRIFWTMFVGIKTIQQLGASFGELVIPPPTPSDPYPPLPAEVDDFCIFPSHNEPQPPGLLPRTTGFNANVNVYNSYNALATMELAWGADAVTEWERQKCVLLESLQRCKRAVAGLPPELRVYRDADLQDSQTNGTQVYPDVTAPTMLRDPAEVLLNPTTQRTAQDSPEETRRMQYEIQKANIYASCLATRSYLVEKYFNLCDAHDRLSSQTKSSGLGGATTRTEDISTLTDPASSPDNIAEIMREERENIIKDLLVVLSNISTVNCEPSADSFVSLT
nr:hypothetical protein CFP56_19514 [Quercus suber]